MFYLLENYVRFLHKMKAQNSTETHSGVSIKEKRTLLHNVSLWNNDIVGSFLNVVKIGENKFNVQDIWVTRS
jgi:hypothetical protein